MAPTIGQPVRRREDYRFLTGQGTYTDDINRPGQLYAFILRSPHANARINWHRHERGDIGARRRRGLHRQGHGSRRDRRAAVRLADQFEGRLADEGAAASGAGGRSGAPCRRPGRGRHRREPRPGARRRREHRGRLRGRAGGRRSGRGAEARRAAGLAGAGPGQCLLRLASRRRRRGRCRDRQGGAGRQARSRQQPTRAERDGAARRDRRVRPRDQRIHALHDQPEPACDPAADGRLRIAHPGGAAAGRRARCRRRLRLEDLPLRRGGDRHLGRRQGAGSRSNGPPSARKASCPTRMAATTSRMSNWRSTRTPSSPR